MKNLVRNFTLILVTLVAVSCGKEQNKDLEPTSIAKIIEVTPEFSNLKEALEITGLTSTFEGSGDFTVFVPTNDAFAAVLGGLTLEQFDVANPGLIEIVLKYHVLGAKVLSTDLVDSQDAATLQGQNITITLEPNLFYPEFDADLGAYEEKSIYVNGSTRVFARDIKCSNGVIHVINDVLIPPAG